MEAEKIQGDKRFPIFEALAQDQSRLKFRWMGGDYERLTTLRAIREKGNAFFFRIDFDSELKNLIDQRQGWELYFEFLGRDKIRYSFVCVDCEISATEIWLRIPNTVLRHQQRHDFRIRPLFPVHVVFDHSDNRIKQDVVDISFGGMLSLGRIHKKGTTLNALKIHDTIYNLLIDAQVENGEMVAVRLKAARLLRTEKTAVRTHRLYAFKFVEIAPEEEKKMHNLIFLLQRINLRKRIPIRAARQKT